MDEKTGIAKKKNAHAFNPRYERAYDELIGSSKMNFDVLLEFFLFCHFESPWFWPFSVFISSKAFSFITLDR